SDQVEQRLEQQAHCSTRLRPRRAFGAGDAPGRRDPEALCAFGLHFRKEHLQESPDMSRWTFERWPRPECQVWTGALLLGTCLLYCARASMPVCAATMSQDFGWNKKEAGVVLSSFFWGYCLTQVVGGHLGDRTPDVHPGIGLCLFADQPRWAGPQVVLVVQAAQRLPSFEFTPRVYFPALTSLLSQKVRESERAFTYSTVGAGSQFGTLVTGAAGSLLLDWYGWPSVFYFSGGLTLLWVCYVYRCLLGEKDLILALGVLAQGLPVSRHTKVPWRQLFRKPSVWAAIISQLSAACSFFILLSWLPTFFKETFPGSKGWVFNVVPWLVAIPASLFSGLLSDRLINQVCGLCLSLHRPPDLQPQTTGSWTSVFNLVAVISSLGLCTFLVFGKAQRVDLSPAHEDL
ncbi:hypothetical protein E2I00_017066, partial [Balaenoptera physalus]